MVFHQKKYFLMGGKTFLSSLWDLDLQNSTNESAETDTTLVHRHSDCSQAWVLWRSLVHAAVANKSLRFKA